MSALSGMTGFSRVSDEVLDVFWTWEARSVNGKSLDVRLRLPPEFTGLDAPIRKVFSALFKRGNIQLSLMLQSAKAGSDYQINSTLLDELMALADTRREPVRLDQMLLVPGVVMPQSRARAKDDQAVVEEAVLASAQALADKLQMARRSEGTALEPLLSKALDRIESLVINAEGLAATQTKVLQESLSAKFTELLGQNLPQERLAQEAALWALKADVREELDRLKAHCEQGREHLSKGSPIGRKLDFLCQEFNRETNTLCAKSPDIGLTRIGLELKSTVEQFREQAANVE